MLSLEFTRSVGRPPLETSNIMASLCDSSSVTLTPESALDLTANSQPA